MKKYPIIILLLILSCGMQAQEKPLQLEISYPLSSGCNYFSENSTGLVSAGVKYDIMKKNILHFGLAFDYDLFALTSFSNSYAINAMSFTPKIYMNAKLNKFRVGLDAGYKWLQNGYYLLLSGVNTIGITETPIYENQRGITLGLSASYDFSKKIYAFGHYEHSWLKGNHIMYLSYAEKTVSNESMDVFKLGLGFRF